MNIRLSRILLGALLAAALPAATAADGAGDPIGRFDISRFQVEGNTLLPASAVQSLLAPYAGTRRDFGDVQRALEALEAAYRARGYNVVQVVLPEQELNNGVVVLRVVETRIGKVIVQGNKHFDEANIRRSLPLLREGQSPNVAEISESLRVANENPAKKTTLQLQGGDKEDEVNALLRVEDDKTWRVGANVDNSGTGSTGRTHVGVTYQNANLFGRDHVMSLQYTTSAQEPSKVSVYGMGYHIPLYGPGDSIDLFGSYSDVDSGTVTAGVFNLNVSGKGTVFGGRYNKSLARSGDFESKLVFGIDHRAYKNDVSLLGTQIGNDVTVHPLSVGWAGNWTLPAGQAAVTVTALHNIPGGSNGNDDAFAKARVGAKPGYTIVRASASIARAFGNDWQWRVLAGAQLSPDALVPGEQFGAGGGASVRGFAERELANDKGLSATIEAYTPNLCRPAQGAATSQCRVLAFVDAAHASRNKALPSETSEATIAGAGLGLRWAIDRYFALQLDWGRVIDGGGLRRNGDSRMHLFLNLTY